MALREGEKLLMFGMGKDMIADMKFSQIKEFAPLFLKKLKAIESILGKK